MVPSRGRPTLSEWEQIKREFKVKYLEEDLTLRAVIEHFARRGFVATERQFKTKVKSWGYDKKKIRGATFHSMYAVMMDRKRLGLDTKFIVPTHDNHQNRVVTSEMIIKEINRDRTTFDWNNVRRAEAILQNAGVQVVHDDGNNDQSGYGHLPTSQWVNTPAPLGHHQWQPPFILEDSFNISGSEDTLSPSTESMATVVPTNFSLDGMSTTFREEASSMSVPSANWPSLVSERRDRANSNAFSSPDDGFNFASPLAEGSHPFDPAVNMSSLFTEPFVNDPLIAGSPPQTWNSTDQTTRYIDEETQLAMEWLTPYVRSSFSFNRNQVDLNMNSQDRQKARDALRSMLGKSNRYIYPGCNWMVTVLSSNNEIVLLTVFFADCCEVIDNVDPGLELTYGSPFHLSHALWTKNQHERDIYRSKFKNSAFFIRMLWGPESPNNLVNECFSMWLMLDEKEYAEAIPKLRESLLISERIMGDRHVVTVNHLTMLARGLMETNCTDEAISVYKDVCGRLKDCEDLLKAFRFRQIMRLADLQIEVGDVKDAEVNLRAVITFRTEHFGWLAGCTWKSIRTLVGLLEKLGRLEEAGRMLQESTNQHDENLQKAWLEHYKVPAPWI